MSTRSARSMTAAHESVAVMGARGLLGSAVVSAFLANGHSVVAADKLPPAGASSAIELTVDVTDPASVAAVAAEADRRVGPIGILVNCFAVRGRDFFAPVDRATAADLLDVLNAHVVGSFLCCQQFGQLMAARGTGSIVNFGSIYGVVSPDQRIYGTSGINAPASYSAAKGAIIALTKYLASYWGSSGVRVNAISPGGVHADQDPEFVRRYSERVPLGRMATVDEIVSGVLYLASPGASYVTGTNLLVDGGLTAW